jgi:putative endopeptidase
MAGIPQAARDDLALHSVARWGLDVRDRDPSVKPGDDFFMSQNGAWFARTELSPQVPFAAYWNDLRRLTPRRLAAILDEAAADKNASPDSVRAKAGAFYRAFLDEKTVESKGMTPLDPVLSGIRAAKTPSRMAAEMGRAAGPGTLPRQRPIGFIPDGAAFLISIAQDQRDPTRYAVYVGQGGLGMPGPEYYSDPQLADVKLAYETYAAKLLRLMGWPNPELRAKEIVAFETRIAAASWSHEQMLDVVNTYNRMTIAELSAFAPGFDWHAFLAGAELGNVDAVVVDAKSAFPKIASIVAETPLEVLQARQAFAAADLAAPNLYRPAFDANFDFRIRAFNNPTTVPKPRPLQAWYTLEPAIGDMLGTLYVARYFSPESKAKALEMTANMRHAFDARIEKLAWMSPQTKARAREKLAKMNVNIGYPDTVADYTGLDISDTDLYGDVVRASAFDWRRQVRRLDAPFDHSEWVFTPQSVNYSYTPTTNTLEIPAATLQPPFFDLNADDAVNYGAVGALIGSQMIGAFDNRGRHYDADGRLRDWLTADESVKFAAMTTAIAQQYSAIEPLPGLHVKGELVADEAVDDIGGLLVALDAYHLSLNGRPAPVLDGFTGDQRVFLGRAQMWRAKFDRAFVRAQVATGRNAQPFLRVNGPVRNVDAWYAAFGVKPGDKMYLAPQDRVHIW